METPDPSAVERTRSLQAEIQRLRRDRQRLRQTVSFRLGLHLTTAVRRPWRLLALPISFPWLAFRLGLERLGRRPAMLPDVGSTETARSRSVVLFPTNGVGFGHFTRMYALAKQLREADSGLEIIFFTTMPTLHIPYAEDFPTYHLAGRGKHETMEASTWNGLVEDMLHTVLDVHRPAVFVFDGAFPYRGMLNAILQEPNMHRIWVRRGMFRKGSRIPVDSITCFDLLVRPGDALPPALDGIEVSTEQLDVETMLLIEPEGMLDRQAARRRLGLPSDARAVYVQLGAGRINDIESEVRRVVDALHAQPDVHVVLGESMLGARLDVDLDRIHLLRDYPNALYLKAFDASVQAGGYNSFHEMRSLRLPTLFLPNLSTGMDDQVARCNIAVQEGWGCVNLDRSANALAHDVEALLSMEPQPSPAPEANGARSLATQILSLLGEDA